MTRNGIARFFPAFAAGIVLIASALPVRSQTMLEIEPRFAQLGSFSAENPSGNVLNPGATTLKITSHLPWTAEATLVQSARRLSDNLELPLERVRQMFPDLESFCNYGETRLDYGPGSPDIQMVSFDWQLIQSRLSQYLEIFDPPGVYRFSVRIQLHSQDSTTVSNAVLLTAEFTVLPHIEIETRNVTIAFPVEHPGEPTESDPAYIRVLSNCAWSLEMGWTGDLDQEGNDFRIEHNRVSWIVGGGDGWQSLIPAYTPVARGPVMAARGGDPQPFTLTEVDIPIQLRVDTDRTTIHGQYSTQIQFAVHAEITAMK